MRTTISIPSAGLALLSACLFTASCGKEEVKLSEPLASQDKELTVTACIAGYGDTNLHYS